MFDGTKENTEDILTNKQKKKEIFNQSSNFKFINWSIYIFVIVIVNSFIKDGKVGTKIMLK